MRSETKPDIKCPECEHQAWPTGGPSKEGRLNIRCALGHQKTIDTPDGWKPEKPKLRPQTRGFY